MSAVVKRLNQDATC